MKKEININFKDIKNSPYLVAVGMVLLIVVLIVATVFLAQNVNKTKTELVEARASLKSNAEELANLEELRAKSEEAEAKLKYLEGILPEQLGDAYQMEEELEASLADFGLTLVSKSETAQNQSTTVETVFTYTVSGSYSDIMVYMQYVNNLEQIHRFDSCTLTLGDNGNYNAALTLAVLSKNGASGIETVGAVQEVVQEVVEEETEATE